MTDREPFPLTPAEVLPRGEFPEHSDEPQPTLTADEARARARARLEQWRADHGN